MPQTRISSTTIKSTANRRPRRISPQGHYQTQLTNSNKTPRRSKNAITPRKDMLCHVNITQTELNITAVPADLSAFNENKIRMQRQEIDILWQEKVQRQLDRCDRSLIWLDKLMKKRRIHDIDGEKLKEFRSDFPSDDETSEC